jgi:hypothetical protein
MMPASPLPLLGQLQAGHGELAGLDALLDAGIDPQVRAEDGRAAAERRRRAT